MWYSSALRVPCGTPFPLEFTGTIRALASLNSQLRSINRRSLYLSMSGRLTSPKCLYRRPFPWQSICFGTTAASSSFYITNIKLDPARCEKSIHLSAACYRRVSLIPSTFLMMLLRLQLQVDHRLQHFALDLLQFVILIILDHNCCIRQSHYAGL